MRTPLIVSMLLCLCLGAGTASAATVSGTVKGGSGLRLVVVQADGKGARATLPASGAFHISASTKGATLHLISASGSYLGPVVLGGSGTRVYMTLANARSVNLGTITRKAGYAVARAPKGAYLTTPATTASARAGKPIGAGRLGRVKVGNGIAPLKGYNGQGRDADLDGIVGAFDADDNGNLILDNVDRTSRAGKTAAGRALRQVAPVPPGGTPVGPPVDGPQAPGAGRADTFKMFSNFKLTGAESINVYLGGSAAAVQPLIDQYVPTTVTLATQVMSGSSATLDCLGNVYCASHTVGTVSYPLVNGTPATVSGSVVDIVTGATGDAQITPGATPTEIGAGNAFLQTAGGSTYPGILNFVFNTAPAVSSVTAGGATTTLGYAAASGRVTSPSADYGMTPANPILVGTDGIITLSWYRPQRPALAGEASASGYIDMGALLYTADAPNKPNNGGPRSGGNCSSASYSGAQSNGTPFTIDSTVAGVLDPAADEAADPALPSAHLLQYTINAQTCFGTDWIGTSGTTFDFDIQARSVYGDNAARKLYFKIR